MIHREAILRQFLCLFWFSREYVKCISRTRPRKYLLPRRRKTKKKKKALRKTDESCETLIGAGFPRYQEIVKRFMKAFMKGFTRHGPNWGPGFASATHVLPRRWGGRPPSSPPETPRGPTCARPCSSLSFPLRANETRFLYRSSKVPRFSSSSSYPSSILCSISSLFLFFLSSFLFFYALLSSSDIFHGQYFPRLKLFHDGKLMLDKAFRARAPECRRYLHKRKRAKRAIRPSLEFSHLIQFPQRLRFFPTAIRTIVARAALTSASGSIGSPRVFCSPIKFWVRERR